MNIGGGAPGAQGLLGGPPLPPVGFLPVPGQPDLFYYAFPVGPGAQGQAQIAPDPNHVDKTFKISSALKLEPIPKCTRATFPEWSIKISMFLQAISLWHVVTGPASDRPDAIDLDIARDEGYDAANEKLAR